jgi:hypothetical protein
MLQICRDLRGEIGVVDLLAEGLRVVGEFLPGFGDTGAVIADPGEPRRKQVTSDRIMHHVAFHVPLHDLGDGLRCVDDCRRARPSKLITVRAITASVASDASR